MPYSLVSPLKLMYPDAIPLSYSPVPRLRGWRLRLRVQTRAQTRTHPRLQLYYEDENHQGRKQLIGSFSNPDVATEKTHDFLSGLLGSHGDGYELGEFYDKYRREIHVWDDDPDNDGHVCCVEIKEVPEIQERDKAAKIWGRVWVLKVDGEVRGLYVNAQSMRQAMAEEMLVVRAKVTVVDCLTMNIY